MILPNGNKFQGYFEDGKYNGEGIFTKNNGEIIKEGIWKNDKFLYTQKIKILEKNYEDVAKPNTTFKELNALKLKVENEERKRKELQNILYN